MANQIKGQWAAQDTKNILRSVQAVFDSQDIGKLSKKAYQHITLHMGFIAHYSLAGFQDFYSSLNHFAQILLSSEYGIDTGRNRRDAGRYMSDSTKFFAEQYGEVYCQSVCDCNIGIVEAAEKFLKI